MDGVIIINKPTGYTSNDVVQKVRRILNTKKVGHAGTLDPLATGVLLILVGQGTKLSKYLIEHDKTYIAEITLGIKTDTGDMEGNIIEENDVPKLDIEEIKHVLESFIGKQKQLPPMYSAIKKDGKKLYEYARKGIEVKVEPRTIEIKGIKYLSNTKNTINFEVTCSKGTYIRTLCEDISQKLGTVGFMSKLIRTRVNQFKIEDAQELENIKSCISIEEIFCDKKCIELDKKNIKLFLNGVMLKNCEQDGIYKIIDSDSQFIGTGIVEKHKLKRDIIL